MRNDSKASVFDQHTLALLIKKFVAEAESLSLKEADQLAGRSVIDPAELISRDMQRSSFLTRIAAGSSCQRFVCASCNTDGSYKHALEEMQVAETCLLRLAATDTNI